MAKTGMLLPNPKHGKGFTLIELMVVVTIIGILASIAIPSYQGYLRKARRGEGKADLLKIQLGLEKWRANNTTYSSSLSDAGFTDSSDYYNYAISGTGANTYTITATAQGSQTGDTGCTSLTLNQSSTKGPSGCW